MSLLTALSPDHLVASYGLIGVVFIIFAETGLLIGLFLPGDSLLFLAGVYAATSRPGAPHLQLIPLLIGVALAAVLGGFVGFGIGKFAGHRLFNKPNSRLFKPAYLERTHEVLEKYGETKAVMLARVIPIVRSFISPVVGMISMPLWKFSIANIVGGLVWAVGITLLGYSLGAAINVDTYILPITALIIVISVVPVVREYLKQSRKPAA